MTIETVEALVVGAGQAGLAASAHLGRAGVRHLVLERDRIAERWRSARWDSLVANGPAWHDRFPDLEFPTPADGFPGKEEVARYFETYARQIDAPVRTGVTVTGVRRLPGQGGFEVSTSQGLVRAEYIIAATGPFQTPEIPQIVPVQPGLTQMHSSDYRNPGQLAPGAVLVVGAGSSGAQIADELQGAGRRVFLSVGPHGRPPRRYRDRDFVWWLGVLNKWDAEVQPGDQHVTIAVSGVDGGRPVEFRRLAHQGMVLLGRVEGFSDGRLAVAGDLQRNIAAGDENYLSLLREADAFVAANGLDLPAEPEAHVLPPDPECVANPLRSVDLQAEGITTIIWATGFGVDYGWLGGDALDANGRPRHRRGVSTESGVYFLGLPWQTRRGSSFIWGVWYDAKYIVDHLLKQRAYMAYRPTQR
ncbi:MAG: NAD(P)/FAD-dependent oxidoreductase [Paracoccaceae bacterium]